MQHCWAPHITGWRKSDQIQLVNWIETVLISTQCRIPWTLIEPVVCTIREGINTVGVAVMQHLPAWPVRIYRKVSYPQSLQPATGTPFIRRCSRFPDELKKRLRITKSTEIEMIVPAAMQHWETRRIGISRHIDQGQDRYWVMTKGIWATIPWELIYCIGWISLKKVHPVGAAIMNIAQRRKFVSARARSLYPLYSFDIVY